MRLMSNRPSSLKAPVVQISTRWEQRFGQVGYKTWANNELYVPSRAIGSVFQIRIEVSDTWVPALEGIGADTRELGVAVSLGF